MLPLFISLILDVLQATPLSETLFNRDLLYPPQSSIRVYRRYFTQFTATSRDFGYGFEGPPCRKRESFTAAILTKHGVGLDTSAAIRIESDKSLEVFIQKADPLVKWKDARPIARNKQETVRIP